MQTTRAIFCEFYVGRKYQTSPLSIKLSKINPFVHKTQVILLRLWCLWINFYDIFYKKKKGKTKTVSSKTCPSNKEALEKK